MKIVLGFWESWYGQVGRINAVASQKPGGTLEQRETTTLSLRRPDALAQTREITKRAVPHISRKHITY